MHTIKSNLERLFEEHKIKGVGKVENVKQKGSEHYKTDGNVEPIDLYRSGGLLWDFGLANIIKYAFRMRRDAPAREAELDLKDLDKIAHYVEILKAEIERTKSK